jgi:hypothetical protein
VRSVAGDSAHTAAGQLLGTALRPGGPIRATVISLAVRIVHYLAVAARRGGEADGAARRYCVLPSAKLSKRAAPGFSATPLDVPA